MYDYGEACPISRASSILCERWTLQIVREMSLGATRFSEFQRYLPKISPSLLNARLRFLQEQGVIIKRRIPEKRGHEYQLSPSGKALAPLLHEMGKWGMEWAHEGIDALPAGDLVLQFKFSDLGPEATRFILVQRDSREVCNENPGHEVDVYFESTLRTLTEIFWGDRDLIKAVESGALGVVGASAYTKRLSRWFPVSSFAGYNRVGRQRAG